MSNDLIKQQLEELVMIRAKTAVDDIINRLDYSYDLQFEKASFDRDSDSAILAINHDGNGYNIELSSDGWARAYHRTGNGRSLTMSVMPVAIRKIMGCCAEFYGAIRNICQEAEESLA